MWTQEPPGPPTKLGPNSLQTSHCSPPGLCSGNLEGIPAETPMQGQGQVGGTPRWKGGRRSLPG